MVSVFFHTYLEFMLLRSMTFVTTQPNRCEHLWHSLLQKF
jgi:hypothetical protein